MEILENVSLKDLTTFRVGGPARFFCRIAIPEDISEALKFADEKKVPVFILGGGSNIVVDDDGISGLVMKIEIKGLEFKDVPKGVEVVAGAGEEWDGLVKATVEKGLYGLENLSLVPGSVGAAPVQNIGAYGVEAGEAIEWVEVFDMKKRVLKRLSKKECAFGYRDSIFKHTEGKGYVITRVAFLLSSHGRVDISYPDLAKYFSEKGTSPDLKEVRDAVIAIRTAKLPNVATVGTAGSFFKNPIIPSKTYLELKRRFPEMPSYPAGFSHVKVPLAWIIDRVCGLKGYRIGDAGVHDKQALVIVNHGGASARDVRTLAAFIAQNVKEKTGIEIESEVLYVS